MDLRLVDLKFVAPQPGPFLRLVDLRLVDLRLVALRVVDLRLWDLKFVAPLPGPSPMLVVLIVGLPQPGPPTLLPDIAGPLIPTLPRLIPMAEPPPPPMLPPCPPWQSRHPRPCYHRAHAPLPQEP